MNLASYLAGFSNRHEGGSVCPNQGGFEWAALDTAALYKQIVVYEATKEDIDKRRKKAKGQKQGVALHGTNREGSMLATLKGRIE